MSDWLNPLQAKLDQTARPFKLFFRDDDVGWSNRQLYPVLDRFKNYAIPIDLAIIPQALNDAMVENLLFLCRKTKQKIGLHQHGYSHSNHEFLGRKCEFGSHRSKVDQYQDLCQGKKRLNAIFGEALDPIFTPPWNRCSQITIDCLQALDFKILSRDLTAKKLALSGLIEIPVCVDWSGLRKKSRIGNKNLGKQIANALTTSRSTGIMLHHAEMDENDIKLLMDLLCLLASHDNAQCQLLRDFIGQTCDA